MEKKEVLKDVDEVLAQLDIFFKIEDLKSTEYRMKNNLQEAMIHSNKSLAYLKAKGLVLDLKFKIERI